ncbi:hypothetical protein [Treponema sp.]|uniref:hypothetical protein n=1 Tax=Treponema sp. TaxID=166 RepID=UPI00298DFC32|nr:hypothetical protein [Treponema sp.]
MRMFRKKYETPIEAVYEYLCEDYRLPYTGVIKIVKDPMKITVEKPADGEWNEKKAEFSALALVRNKYPKTYTHSAV